MIAPKEIIEEIKQIKDVINRIEFKGEQNANYVLYACQKCDMLINSINEVIKSHEESDKAGE